jgi:hypothetical protein
MYSDYTSVSDFEHILFASDDEEPNRMSDKMIFIAHPKKETITGTDTPKAYITDVFDKYTKFPKNLVLRLDKQYEPIQYELFGIPIGITVSDRDNIYFKFKTVDAVTSTFADGYTTPVSTVKTSFGVYAYSGLSLGNLQVTSRYAPLELPQTPPIELSQMIIQVAPIDADQAASLMKLLYTMCFHVAVYHETPLVTVP